MSNSPYAASMGPSGFDEYQQPGRTSVLAVLAVVSSILCLPPMGIIAILLGAISLSAIGRSKGRLEGRGAAISGIILGLISTVLWGAVAMGGLQVWTYYTKSMVPATDRFFQSASQADFDGARAELTASSAAELTDKQFAWFFGEIESRSGEALGAATSIGTIISAFGEVFGQGNQKGSAGPHFQIEDEGNNSIIPVAITCANESVIAWVVFDEDTLGGGQVPKIVDLFVLFSNGDVVALRHDGPAAMKAEQSGLSDEPLQPDAGEDSELDEGGDDEPEEEVPTS